MYGEGVAQIMDARPGFTGVGDVAGFQQSAEGMPDSAPMEASFLQVDEKRSIGPILFGGEAFFYIGEEGSRGGLTEPDPPVFSKLAFPDEQPAPSGIEIFEIEIYRLSDPDSRCVEQTNQRLVSKGAKGSERPQVVRRGKQITENF